MHHKNAANYQWTSHFLCKISLISSSECLWPTCLITASIIDPWHALSIIPFLSSKGLPDISFSLAGDENTWGPWGRFTFSTRWVSLNTLNFVLEFAFGIQRLFLHCHREKDMEICVNKYVKRYFLFIFY